MNKRVMLVLLLMVGTMPLYAQSEDGQLPRMKDGRLLTGRVAELEMGLASRTLDEEIEVPFQAPLVHDYDQVFIEADIVPNFVDSTFSGIVRLLVRSEITPLASLGFHLHVSTTIDSIVVDETQRSFSRSDAPDLINIAPWLAADGLVTVDLADLNVQADDLVELVIHYHGRFGTGGSSMRYQWSVGSRPRAEVLFTMHEPHDARYWLPCYDQPGDKFDSTRIILTLPESFNVLSNGQLEYEVTKPGEGESLKTTSWLNSHPISSYLVHFTAKDYVVYDAGTAGVNDTPVKFWLYGEWYYQDPVYPIPYTYENAVYDLARTPQMIDVFEEVFGPYPFSKYDQAIMPMGGAMEHQSATSLSDGLAGTGDRQGEITVAHELAHQWWGDYVGPHTFQDIWLNEGFATYSEAIWVEALYPVSVPGFMADMQDAARGQDFGAAYPLSDPAYPYTVPLVYDKGGVVLHMLRLELGDEDFFNGLRNYGLAHAYGSATTAEFQSVMEAESGRDLTPFFDQWVHGKRWPRFDLQHYWSEGDDENGYDTYLIVDQVQTWSQLFATAMSIRVRSLESRDEDTVVTAFVDAARRDTVFVGHFDWMPKYIGFNYKNWVMCDVNVNNLTGVEAPSVTNLPDRFDISTSWPNPFNAATSFDLMLPAAGEVNVDVVNMLGRRVASLSSGPMSAGHHRMSWQPQSNLASGIYLIRVRADGSQMVRRVTLVR